MVKQSSVDIAGLKRQARALSKRSELPLHTCLDKVACENGYPNWALLQKSQVRSAPQTSTKKLLPANDTHGHRNILRALLSFLQSASEADVLRLSRGGSIWVDRHDARTSDFMASSFVALGCAWDGLTTQAGINLDAVLFADLDGIQEKFVFLGDEDDDGKPVVPGSHQVHYTTAVARKYLCAEAPEIIEGSVDALEEAIA